MSEAQTPAGAQLSEDHNYWWDEAAGAWQPVGHAAGAEHAQAVVGGHAGAGGNTVAVKDASGAVLYQGQAHPISVQGALESMGIIEHAVIEEALQIPIEILKAEASSLGATLAVGLQASAAAVLGVEIGAGLYVGPGGELGWYNSLGADFGAVLGASIEAIGAGVQGGPDVFAGQFLSVTLAGGEVVVGGVTVLYSIDGHAFVGLAAHAGLGVGFPVALYGTWSNTWLHPL